MLQPCVQEPSLCPDGSESFDGHGHVLIHYQSIRCDGGKKLLKTGLEMFPRDQSYVLCSQCVLYAL